MSNNLLEEQPFGFLPETDLNPLVDSPCNQCTQNIMWRTKTMDRPDKKPEWIGKITCETRCGYLGSHWLCFILFLMVELASWLGVFCVRM